MGRTTVLKHHRVTTCVAKPSPLVKILPDSLLAMREASPFSRRVDLLRLRVHSLSRTGGVSTRRRVRLTIVKPASREGATAVTPKGGAPVAQIRQEHLLNLAGRCLGHLPRGAPR